MKDWLTEKQRARQGRDERRIRIHAWMLALAYGAPWLAGLREWLGW